MENTEIKVTANQSKRTFTIRKYDNNKLYVKLRTYQMSKEEFEVEEMNTENDWKNFLKSNNHYVVSYY